MTSTWATDSNFGAVREILISTICGEENPSNHPISKDEAPTPGKLRFLLNSERRLSRYCEQQGKVDAILDNYKTVNDQQDRLKMLEILGSYLVRRTVCRLTTKNYNVLFIQVLREFRKRTDRLSPHLLSEILAELSDPSTRMPTDEEFARAFKQEALSNQNAREVLFVLALYDVSNGKADVPRLCLRNYSVEHMMPVKWEANWLEQGMTKEQQSDRDSKLRTLGNLTLVTKRLNSAMQNAAWAVKKSHLKLNSSLRMTTKYLENEKWDEAGIEARAGQLATEALAIWKDIPRIPAGKSDPRNQVSRVKVPCRTSSR